ncbi:unnamed protein product [Linum tenue]|uniref:Uncharacterized protein n=1 Tax=Linum tenue TaxID=586396 RepID=A0AAV0MMW9_9ROSI|nr:unnamed protein product [Linum tenue]CAI0447394.1 unnamed protein product [Linum tenue]
MFVKASAPSHLRTSPS